MRGAWIEIGGGELPGAAARSLPVRGAWIEIVHHAGGRERGSGRSPCGERGLKCNKPRVHTRAVLSLPVRGAWIEITLYHGNYSHNSVAPRAGSVD